MQPSIPWSSSVSVFFHWKGGNHPFFEVYGAAFIRCTTCHSLSLIAIRCHWLSLFVTCYTTHCHCLSLVAPLVVTHCHSLSLEVPLLCLFINDRFSFKIIYSFFVIKERFLKICNFIEFTLRHVFSCKFAVYFRNTFL